MDKALRVIDTTIMENNILHIAVEMDTPFGGACQGFFIDLNTGERYDGDIDGMKPESSL